MAYRGRMLNGVVGAGLLSFSVAAAARHALAARQRTSIVAPALRPSAPVHHEAPATRTRRRRATTVASGLAAVVLLGLSVFVAFWALSGGRWYMVESPSMGTAAPVGTLLWVKPVPYKSIHVGEIIAFHPPTELHETFSHRVIAINANGTLSTRGDINGTVDPWQVHPSDVVGAVAMRWQGVGWLIQASPVLLFGGAMLAVIVTRFVGQKWRLPLATVGASFLISVAIYVYKPLVRVVNISLQSEKGGGLATYVSTGLLPTRMQVPGGRHVDLHDGQLGTILSNHLVHGRFPVTLVPHLEWWWWPAIVAVCFVPSVWTAIVGARADLPVPATG